MFGHDILELQQIPREKEKLRTLISQARKRLKKHRLMNWAALNIFAWGVIILVF